MLDPFPIPPPAPLVRLVKPLADTLHLYTLPLHFHEVLFAAFLYTFTCNTISPFISPLIAPGTYPRLSRRQRLNWDVHVVSFVQAVIINALSLWVIWFDDERAAWRSGGDWEMRTWGYYGSGGLCQSFALGYFLWDLVMCSTHTEIFGVGMLAHAISAVAVFGLGYRPFIYFSAPIFLLYELSSPFLNIHWFCDKLNLTGSIYQAINGACLVLVFFCCRLVWGIWNSVIIFSDFYALYRAGHMDPSRSQPPALSVQDLLDLSQDKDGQLSAFNQDRYIPLWIPFVCLASNFVLNSLNVFWFGKMIETIRTRFDPPWGTKGVGPGYQGYQPILSDSEDSDLGIGEPGKDKHELHHEGDLDGGKARKKMEKKAKQGGGGSIKAARQKAEEALNGPVGTVGDTKVERALYEDGHKGVEVSGTQRKSARSRRKA